MRKLWLVIYLCLLYRVAWAQWPLEQHDSISEVIITPPVNPALRMIEQAALQRKHNSLRANQSFQLVHYQKVYATADAYKQNLFMNECVTKISYLQPNWHKSTVIASKTSGFKEPFLSVWLASQPSFYMDEDDIVFLSEKYLNPISFKGLQNYDYTLDEKIVQNGDTLFKISFGPKKNHFFTALTGELWLHYPEWALHHIRAHAYDSTLKYPLFFEEYFIQNSKGTWVPDSLYANIEFSEPQLPNTTIHFHNISTFRQLQIDCPINREDFDNTDVTDSLSNDIQNELLLSQYRNTPLTAEEKRTYELVDSISHAAGLDRSFAMLEPLTEGFIPIGPLHLDIAKIIDYKDVEGWRFGLGLYTNQRLSRLIRFGGHFAYALVDKRWKGGGRLDFDFGTRWDLSLRLEGGHDLFESGNIYHYDASYAFLSSEYIRQWVVSHYDYGTRINLLLKIQPIKWLKIAVHSNYGIYETGFDYHFQPIPKDDNPRFLFRNFETGICIRLSFKEKNIRTGNLILTTDSPYPVFTLHYARGFKNVIQSDFRYNKLDLNIRYRKNYYNTGYTTISVWSGYTPNQLPASLLYSPMSGYAVVNFDCWEQFATMRSNSFLCDKYALLFLRHNFGKMTNNRKFSPQIILCQNIGFGGLSHPELHQNIEFEDLRKGYFETGIIIDHLVDVFKTCSIGIGIFYHYGPYYQPKTWDNFAVKIKFGII